MKESRLLKEGIQHLFCQHCKALQKTNETVVECWYNPMDYDRAFAFCAANEDAVNEILTKSVKARNEEWVKIGDEFMARAEFASRAMGTQKGVKDFVLGLKKEWEALKRGIDEK